MYIPSNIKSNLMPIQATNTLSQIDFLPLKIISVSCSDIEYQLRIIN